MVFFGVPLIRVPNGCFSSWRSLGVRVSVCFGVVFIFCSLHHEGKEELENVSYRTLRAYLPFLVAFMALAMAEFSGSKMMTSPE